MRETATSNRGDDQIQVDRSHSWRRTLPIIAAIFIFLAISIIVLWFACSSFDRSGMASEALNDGKIPGMASQACILAQGHFPAASIKDSGGEPLLSWRVEMLRVFEAGRAWDRIDKRQARDSAANQEFSAVAPPMYKSPRSTRKSAECTNFVAVVDSNTAIRHEKGLSRKEAIEPGSTRCQVLFIEIPQSDITWSEPRDVSVAEAIRLIKNSNLPRGLVCVLVDGNARFVEPDAPDAELDKLFGT